MTKNNNGFALLIFILFVTIIGVIGLIFVSLLKSNPDAGLPNEKPREFTLESSPIPGDRFKITSTSDSGDSKLTPTPVSGQTLNQKKALKISSLGSVDLGGEFTANLISAWELNNYINAEVVLKNGYSSALGVNAKEFTLHAETVVTKPTASDEAVLNPGETHTLTLTFKAVPNPPYILSYDNPTSHFSSDLGVIYRE
ncbi:hypothetical protein A2962_02610 [Candidatus Woesebacteria bacterium RIFCSPLOWO2_01_FULL_39_61]|uniref:Uncharacterized protein n=1 Tax=Candidatus Woesebacteria bacterium RIFCSPHIGHO2_02_FULL_39_13 TaxID=1802505 RepID=A0A1F7Z545_9BACT|nr:MAG: hypothetical protein A2692_02930 [Candidatus Woesebacteria bacterium RIFCSPHIGHO2_01_FULL_39_95]OGM34687.1 MAG: hypothetical protein A3D01_04135 [Candidatus Woesebacteria bacterium RIFCSPHIGHO2_02_FULL_39_13]OGM38696.1 MAG: hypothetical protein A3E13_04510 [Candidatus Woesebacteria bacterium RIFCSPHIGHO2_12_FULL_40_20]OGM67230.1 MAG: hypothetical protein A2962_02610 [Candidatus Woesebacteria bacterium RIFCSPLOWO2_01_FULL_39_61]OGM75418.1 MAG: hypothetical protein A3H19_03575 [Candidatus